MLKVRDLSYVRDNQKIFSDLTFDCPPATVTQIIGPNGAGKSSLLKILVGLSTATQGTLRGVESVLYMGHQLALHPSLNARQNLSYLLALNTGFQVPPEEITIALETVGLASVAHLPCSLLSRGQYQRLAIARLCVDQSTLWALDEPCTALDAFGMVIFKDQLLLHLGRGGMAVIATHQPINTDPFEQQILKLNTATVDNGIDACLNP